MLQFHMFLIQLRNSGTPKTEEIGLTFRKYFGIPKSGRTLDPQRSYILNDWIPTAHYDYLSISLRHRAPISERSW